MSKGKYLSEDEIVDLLYLNNFCLVRGDLIMLINDQYYSNKGMFIFDGHKIINLEYKLNTHGYLPY